ncbi:hypothetical protein LTR37_015047 [Vermiconidia calcicola]|uniref:Uncharacterized protein n=1 Tax=Vermiconidia calcicola TaxID=1690605 RepID=A0ACC3MUN4_9PEZI|nr:hypothetical protein LTR37_015047 [Vermiconidia calcicola]
MAEDHHRTPRRTPKALRQLKPRISPPLLLEEATSESSSNGYIAANVTETRQGNQQGHHGQQAQGLRDNAQEAPWLANWRGPQPRTLHNMQAQAATFTPTVTVLPKNFSQPLTCFYWHTYGWCTKSDDQCSYAHHDTGVVASAPLALGNGKRSLAGRNASQEIDAQTARMKKLLDWETRLKAKEMKLNEMSAGKSTSHNNTAAVAKIHEALAKARTATDSAHHTLDYYRAELATAISAIQSNDSSSSTNTPHALRSMDAAIAAVADVLVDLASLEKENMEPFA